MPVRFGTARAGTKRHHRVTGCLTLAGTKRHQCVTLCPCVPHGTGRNKASPRGDWVPVRSFTALAGTKRSGPRNVATRASQNGHRQRLRPRGPPPLHCRRPGAPAAASAGTRTRLRPHVQLSALCATGCAAVAQVGTRMRHRPHETHFKQDAFLRRPDRALLAPLGAVQTC